MVIGGMSSVQVVGNVVQAVGREEEEESAGPLAPQLYSISTESPSGPANPWQCFLYCGVLRFLWGLLFGGTGATPPPGPSDKHNITPFLDDRQGGSPHSPPSIEGEGVFIPGGGWTEHDKKPLSDPSPYEGALVGGSPIVYNNLKYPRPPSPVTSCPSPPPPPPPSPLFSAGTAPAPLCLAKQPSFPSADSSPLMRGRTAPPQNALVVAEKLPQTAVVSESSTLVPRSSPPSSIESSRPQTPRGEEKDGMATVQTLGSPSPPLSPPTTCTPSASPVPEPAPLPPPADREPGEKSNYSYSEKQATGRKSDGGRKGGGQGAGSKGGRGRNRL